MKKTIRLILALAIVMGTVSACKSKQQITEVPAGANVKATTATAPATVAEQSPSAANSNNVQATVVETPGVTSPAYSNNTNTGGYVRPSNDNAGASVNVSTSEPEVTRNENFTLVDGESAVFKSKYHVVVGSFSKAENAKGLQTNLKAEGNKAIVVKNEKGMYRVLISSFNDYYKAHDHIKQISGRFPDAWVLVQK